MEIFGLSVIMFVGVTSVLCWVIWYSIRSGVKRGQSMAQSNQASEALEHIHDAKRIADQIDADNAALSDDDLRDRLRTSYKRH